MKFSYLTVLAFASTVLGQTTFHSRLDFNKCMDVNNNEQTPGTQVTIYDCSGSTAQQWDIDDSVSVIRLFSNQSLCLDGGSSPGALATIQTCDLNSSSQRFYYTQNNSIRLIKTGLCITVSNDDTTNGNPLVLEVCDTQGDGQVWYPAQIAPQ